MPGGADLWAGLGRTAKGRAVLAEAVPAPRYGGPSGAGYRRGKTDPGSPTAEDGSSGLTGLTGLCHVAAWRLGGLTASGRRTRPVPVVRRPDPSINEQPLRPIEVMT